MDCGVAELQMVGTCGNRGGFSGSMVISWDFIVSPLDFNIFQTPSSEKTRPGEMVDLNGDTWCFCVDFMVISWDISW